MSRARLWRHPQGLAGIGRAFPPACCPGALKAGPYESETTCAGRGAGTDAKGPSERPGGASHGGYSGNVGECRALTGAVA